MSIPARCLVVVGFNAYVPRQRLIDEAVRHLIGENPTRGGHYITFALIPFPFCIYHHSADAERPTDIPTLSVGTRTTVTLRTSLGLITPRRGCVKGCSFSRAILSEISTPVALWYGKVDNFVPVAMRRYLAKQIPGSHLHLVPDGGHFSTINNHAGAILAGLREASAG